MRSPSSMMGRSANRPLRNRYAATLPAPSRAMDLRWYFVSGRDKGAAARNQRHRYVMASVVVRLCGSPRHRTTTPAVV